jgi:hypothetical protein
VNAIYGNVYDKCNICKIESRFFINKIGKNGEKINVDVDIFFKKASSVINKNTKDH